MASAKIGATSAAVEVFGGLRNTKIGDLQKTYKFSKEYQMY
jgi:hypothetical protein